MINFFDFHFRADTETYKSREALIQGLYDKYGSNVNFEILYREFQRVNEDIETDVKQECYKEEKELKDFERVWTDSDRYWFYIKKQDCAAMDIIKVYATPLDSTRLMDIYHGAVSLLINSKNGFASKASKFKRVDPLCFWVEREDFFRLEEYLRQFELERVLPFIPYRGNIGISRETVESYNGSIAKLMMLYFATKPIKVNLVDMYSFLVNLMNSKEETEDYYNIHFLKEPHTVAVLVKSMEVLVNEEEIKDDNMLLWNTYELQHIVRGLKNDRRRYKAAFH